MAPTTEQAGEPVRRALVPHRRQSSEYEAVGSIDRRIPEQNRESSPIFTDEDSSLVDMFRVSVFEKSDISSFSPNHYQKEARRSNNHDSIGSTSTFMLVCFVKTPSTYKIVNSN